MNKPEDSPVSRAEFEAFKQGIDNWMKDVAAALSAVGNDMQDASGVVNANVEDLQFQYENMERLEQKVTRLEEQMKGIRSVLVRMSRPQWAVPRVKQP